MNIMPLILSLLLFLVSLAGASTQFVILSLGQDQKIATYKLDPLESSLLLQHEIETKGMPTAMCVNKEQTRLYVSMKNTNSLASYSISENGKLTLLGESNMGAHACFLSIPPDKNHLLSAYYQAGKVAVHRLDQNGRISAKPLHYFATDERAHSIVPHPSGTSVFVSHTRPNAIHQFHFNPETGALRPNKQATLQTGPDTGPRHLAFHSEYPHAYGSDEQGKSITAYRFTPETSTLAKIQTLSTQPTDGVDGRSSTSDIEVHPSGNLVFIANRGYNFLASFSIEPNGKLTPLQHTATEAVTRSFNITADGKHLIAAGQQSGNLAIFRIAKDGKLTRTSTIAAGQNPWWVQTITRSSHDSSPSSSLRPHPQLGSLRNLPWPGHDERRGARVHSRTSQADLAVIRFGA